MKAAAFNPEMFLVAREYRGDSQSSLAKKSQISQARLSKIENGVSLPDDDVIEAIAEQLNFPVNFFYQSGRAIGQPMSVHAMFRKRASVGVKALNKLTAELSIRLLNLKALLRSVDIDASLRLPEYDIEDYDHDSVAIAKMIRNTWLLKNGPVTNLTNLIEKSGVVIFWCDFSYAMVDGVSLRIPGLPPCIFLNRDRPADRMRFSLAHELGHLVMHRQTSETMENEANAFAAELLMPAESIIPDLRGKITLAELARLKRVWRVAMQALLMRAKTLGLISRNQSEYLWRQMSMYGYRKQEPINTEFPHEIPQTLSEIIKLHESQLEYSIDDFARMARISNGDFKYLYASNLLPDKKLRLVK